VITFRSSCLVSCPATSPEPSAECLLLSIWDHHTVAACPASDRRTYERLERTLFYDKPYWCLLCSRTRPFAYTMQQERGLHQHYYHGVEATADGNTGSA
jgi:hypothetical protein